MKLGTHSIVSFLAIALLFVACGKENQPTKQSSKTVERKENKKQKEKEKGKGTEKGTEEGAEKEKGTNPANPKTFKLADSKAVVDLDKGTTVSVAIVSGSGKYQVEPISEDAKGKVTATLSGEVITITTTSTTRVTTTITVTDLTLGQKLPLAVTILPKSIPHYAPILKSMTRGEFRAKSATEQATIIQETITKVEDLLKSIEALEEAQRDADKAHEELFKMGKEIYARAKSSYESYRNKESQMNGAGSEVYGLYSDIYCNGIGYFTLEYLDRSATKWSSKYPENEAIRECLKEMFSAKYLHLFGDQLIEGVNKSGVSLYNKIIDLINKYERR